MEYILPILGQLGLGVASNAIYDWMAGLNSTRSRDIDIVASDLQNKLNIIGCEIKAENVIEILANGGLLRIEKTKVYSSEGITFGSTGGSAQFGNNSSMMTKSTAIVAEGDAGIHTTGNAQVRQNSDGSISFLVG